MEKEILTGIAASIGEATGRVRIVHSSADAPNFQDGEILVTKLTNPTMIMMMAKAAAIVTDVGGLTSHPAIVSREMGTPCVVSTKVATTVLKDGMLVRVDGKNGKIYLIEEEV
ncbi:MAG: PEP-utilizing enzyme [bacterium]|nr:PEP-utilizing enzyme [bacterium]